MTLSFMRPDAPFCLKWHTPHHQQSLLESVSTILSHSSHADNIIYGMRWLVETYGAFACILAICLNCDGNCQDSELPAWQVYVIQCRSCFEEWMVCRCCIFLLTFRKSRLLKCFCSRPILRSWHHSHNYQCSPSHRLRHYPLRHHSSHCSCALVVSSCLVTRARSFSWFSYHFCLITGFFVSSFALQLFSPRWQ